MRNLWARVNPEDLIEREGGEAKGFAMTILDGFDSYNVARARKRLAEDDPYIVGRWNLKWLCHPDIDTYFFDTECDQGEEGKLPRTFWDRLFLSAALLHDNTRIGGKALWQHAAQTTPQEFVDLILPPTEETERWFRALIGEEDNGMYVPGDNSPDDFGRLSRALQFVGQKPGQKASDFNGWLDEARARAAAWVPHTPAAQPERKENVIHVNFGRP